MKTSSIFLLFLAGSLSASDAQFNGRWDITVSGDARGRAWWLEVQDAGTPGIRGMFVGAPGGQVDDIPEIGVKDGELTFVFKRNYRGQGESSGVYRARLSSEKLLGTFAVEGRSGERVEWTGVRAPKLPQKDDGKWKKGKVVELFDGKSLTGWKPVVAGKDPGWSAVNGLLTNSRGARDIVCEPKFWNFDLHVEYRIQKGSNSGVGLRARYEVQIFDDFGQAPSKHGNGALYSRIVPAVNASKAPGEWQTMDVRLIGREVTVVLNGTKVIDRREIAGLTAMATNPNEAEPGPISLQGDHGSVEFRKISVTPLSR